MSCDLEKHFGDFLDSLPIDEEDEEADSIHLTAETIPKISAVIESDALNVKPGLHIYKDRPTTVVLFECQRRTLQALGALLLSGVLHASHAQVILTVTSTNSEISEVLFDFEGVFSVRGSAARYYHQITSFEYYFTDYSRYPLTDINPNFSPLVILTRGEFGLGSWEEFITPNRVRITGNASALLDLAHVFLNVGRPNASATELDFEAPFGSGGVACGSSELRVWLPGSPGSGNLTI
ncbi:MAG: hypothetical protein AAGF24_09260 [Cyanobacteria bacterium P01_H01_bin.121]